MNERLKELRLDLNLNQQEFGDKINISRPHVASLESGSRNLTERTLSDISREFNASEEWLKTGQGKMFIQKNSTIITKLSEEYDLDSIDIGIIKGYLELDSDQRKTIKQYVASIAKAITYEDDINKEMKSSNLEPKE